MTTLSSTSLALTVNGEPRRAAAGATPEPLELSVTGEHSPLAARVRGIEVHDEAAASAGRGQRSASACHFGKWFMH